MQGKATVFGHPIHPMLIPFPIAFLTGSFIADIIYFLTDADFWTSMGTMLMGFGIVGALLAAVFGFIDYLTAPMPPRTKSTATKHMVINLAIVALFIVNFVVRRQNPETMLGYLLSVVGILALIVSGWLGGELVFKGHVGTVREERAPAPAAPPPRGQGPLRR